METKTKRKSKKSVEERKIDRILAEHQRNRKALLAEKDELLQDREEYPLG